MNGSMDLKTYSTGEIGYYQFKGKKAKDLIIKWNNDESIQLFA